MLVSVNPKEPHWFANEWGFFITGAVNWWMSPCYGRCPAWRFYPWGESNNGFFNKILGISGSCCLLFSLILWDYAKNAKISTYVLGLKIPSKGAGRFEFINKDDLPTVFAQLSSYFNIKIKILVQYVYGNFFLAGENILFVAIKLKH